VRGLAFRIRRASLPLVDESLSNEVSGLPLGELDRLLLRRKVMNDRKRDRAQGVAVDHRLRQRSSVRLSKMANIVPSGPYTQRDHPVTTPTVAEPRVSHAALRSLCSDSRYLQLQYARPCVAGSFDRMDSTPRPVVGVQLCTSLYASKAGVALPAARWHTPCLYRSAVDSRHGYELLLEGYV
jgi:hypothetical protein